MPGGVRLIALFFAIFLAGPLSAFETNLVAKGAPDALHKRLTAASAALSAQRRGVTSAQEVFAAALSDYRTLVEVLYDEGYFGPVVNIRVDGREAANIPPLDAPRSIKRVEITVQPGRPFRFGQARVAPVTETTVLPEGFRTGSPATTALIRDAARAGVTGWREAGYAKAEVSGQRIVADHRQAEIDADIRLAPGRQLRFGRMIVTADSNTRVRQEAIQRIAGFPSGAVYHPDDVQKVGERLRRTGTFASVNLRERDNANPDGTLDFDATFDDNKPRRISFGGDLTSRQGVDIRFEWMHRNLFGGAERFRFETQLRGIGGQDPMDGLFSMRLDRPAVFGPDIDMYYQIGIELLDEEYYRSLHGYAGLGIKRIYSDRLFAEVGINLNRSRASDAFTAAAGIDQRNFYFAGLPGRVEWDMRDNSVNARNGFYLDARVMPFYGFKGTDSGIHAKIDGRSYLSLTRSGSIVIAGRVQVGSVMGASLTGVPPEMLFFSGGAGTVRGQPYQSLGSLTLGTEQAGGRSLLAGSLEIRGQVTDKISLVGFFDAGMVGTDAFVDSNSRYHSGAGLGVRYDVGGIGPIRLDLAMPVDGFTGDGLQFYLGIGQAF